MLSWFRGKSEAQEASPPEAQSTSASVAQKTPEHPLSMPVVEPLKRAEPATQAEAEMAEQFKAAVKTCRDKFVEPGFDLPTLPASAMRITTLLQDPHISVRQVSDAVAFDPVMTAKFLRIANSPMYAGTRRIDSVQIAVQRLGMNMVKSVVLAISLNSTIIREKRLGQHALELWEHSMSTALAAQVLARRLQLDHASAFTMGLMHDIGKLAAWLLLLRLSKNQADVRPAVMETLVEDAHSAVGEALVDVWSMPFEIRTIVGGHHVSQTLDQAAQFVRARKPEISAPAAEMLASQMGCVILADKSMAALGLAREPGDLNLGDSSLAVDLGLPSKALLEYLGELPGILHENKDF